MGKVSSVWFREKHHRVLNTLAKDYGLTVSEVIAEMVEWVLDQESAFRKDLEEELPEEEEEEPEEEAEESEETEEESEEED